MSAEDQMRATLLHLGASPAKAEQVIAETVTATREVRAKIRAEVLAEIARLFDDRGQALLDGGIMTATDAAELIRQHAAGTPVPTTRVCSRCGRPLADHAGWALRHLYTEPLYTDPTPGTCGAREPEPRTGIQPCALTAGHGGDRHRDHWGNQWPGSQHDTSTAGKDTRDGTQPPAGESTHTVADTAPPERRERYAAALRAEDVLSAVIAVANDETDPVYMSGYNTGWQHAGGKWVSCSWRPCPNGEIYSKATKRGWTCGPMGAWLCAEHTPSGDQ